MSDRGNVKEREPHDATGIWSWDPDRLLVGRCTAELRIVRRFDETTEESA